MKPILTTLALLTLLYVHAQSDLLKAIGGLKVEEDNSPFVPNEFIGSFVLEQHHYKNGEERKSSPNTMHYWGCEDKTILYNLDKGATDADMRILTDLRAKYTYSLQTDKNGRKTALKMRKKNMTVKTDPGDAPPEVTVTAETKTILGYTCVKTISKDKHGSWTGWIAQDVKAPFGDFMRSLGIGDTGKLSGFALESEFIDADGKNRTTNIVKELKVGPVDAAVFSLDGYEIQELPGLGN